MTEPDTQETRDRLMLYLTLSCFAEALNKWMHRSVDDTLDALLSLVRKGYVVVATDREGFRLELTEKGKEVARELE
jgi:hypothetical protein